jgi:THO complex subunit 2
MRHHISKNAELFIRVSRLFEAHIKAIAPSMCLEKSSGSKMKENKQTHTQGQGQGEGLLLQPALDMIECALLPALTVSDFNPAAPRQLWRVISLLPFQLRYSLYDLWRGAGLGKDGLGVKHSQVVMAEVTALHQARYHLKRLAKENVKSIGVKLINTSEGAPIVVYNHVLNQIESYDNLIPYMVEALKTCSALSNDVMTYCIVNQLGKDTEKLKKGDTHYSSWFSALAKFTAFFFKKYPHSELKGTGSFPICFLFFFISTKNCIITILLS